MDYRIEYGASDKRVSIGEVTTSTVMGLYDKAVSAGEENITIHDERGERLDPHQLRLNLHSKWDD